MNIKNGQSTVIRTDRGLTIAGTRITLYQIMDYIKAERPSEMIRDQFRLTIKQTADVLNYIDAHRDEVETEYQKVLAEAEEDRQYWEARNREHLTKIKPRLPNPDQEHLYAKLKAAKARLGMDEWKSWSTTNPMLYHPPPQY